MFLKFLLLFVFKIEWDECPYNGAFPVPHTFCKTYRICDRDGARKLNCPTVTLFNPRAQKCFLGYVCPDTAICTHVPPGLYADPNYLLSNTYYIECVRTICGVLVKYRQCKYGQIFQRSSVFPYSGSCQKIVEITTENPTITDITTINTSVTETTESTMVDNITEITTLTPLPTLIPIPSADCQKEGVFPVYHSDCKAYMVCKMTDTSFTQYKYLCSTSSFFDPWKSECVIGYKCLEVACANQPQNSLHADPNGISKDRYYQCAMDYSGAMIPLYLQCETGSFDDDKKACGFVMMPMSNSHQKFAGILQWALSTIKWLIQMK